MQKKLIIIGASGHGKVVADVAEKMGRWKTIMFLDDDKSVDKFLDYDVIGTLEEASKYKETANFFVAIGNNSIREKIQEKLMKQNFSIATLVHPDATVGIDIELGSGTVIMAHAVVNSATKIGNGCIINTSSSIDHDNILEEYVHISPGVRTGGNVFIGKKSWLGIGSIIINNISITEKSVIGAGGVVLEDIIHPGTYIGVPVRRKS